MTGRRTHIRIPVAGRYITPLGDEFASVEALGGIVLLLAALAALAWVNSPWTDAYSSLWNRQLTIGVGEFAISETLRSWVNDGLMTVFFFVVGLEIKRELVEGELNEMRKARLPALAALGGMVAPALIFLAWNLGGPGSRGWGIPMATDLAFALGVLALLGSRVPPGLKLFLLTLAIVDDIGAIIVIAVFYSGGVEAAWLGCAAAALGVFFLMRALGARRAVLYVLPALTLWVCTFESGVHATIAGVALGLLTPAGSFRDRRVLEQLERRLHLWTSFLVVPVFALANAGVSVGVDALRNAASSRITWGIVCGLVVGKIVGITLATGIGLRMGLGRLPEGVTFRQVVGVGALAGIGFTVSLFVADLSFGGRSLSEAKIGILGASLIAGMLGSGVLLRRPRRTLRPGGR
jgi:Na+:H+ antiporter, NhaA family